MQASPVLASQDTNHEAFYLLTHIKKNKDVLGIPQRFMRLFDSFTYIV